MKIGLEYEGVIINKWNEPWRWSRIPDSARSIICEQADDPSPVDGYDCLAEARIQPMTNPDPRDLARCLLDKVASIDTGFRLASQGGDTYVVDWSERLIDEYLHNDIVASLNFERKDCTKVIGAKGLDIYKSAGNQFRGGGMHMTVSPVDHRKAAGLVLELHSVLDHWRSEFRSNYRHDILFRTKTSAMTDEPMVEYMSFGFKLPCGRTDQFSVDILAEYLNIAMNRVRAYVD